MSTAVLGIQLIVLLVYTTHLYQRFDVSVDFAHNAQAWYLIGHGNLNPVDTVRITPTPFWRDHFDLVIWPLSLLRWISPGPVVLLWVQDLAIVAAELITLFWVAAICAERLKSRRNAAGIVAMVALVANPWWYETASFDVHMPPLGLPFLVYAGYALWRGRFRAALVASVSALLFGAVVAELVFVLGVAAVCSRRVRRSGGTRWAAGIAAIGLAWIGLIGLLGANQASNIASNYGYLADPGQSVTLFHIVKGAALHPARLTRVLSRRWRAILFELLPTGFVGLVTPWGFFLFVGVLVPFALTSSFAYSSPTGGAFQNLPAMPFIFIGSVMVLTRLATSAPRRHWLPAKPAAAIAVGLASVATVLSLAQGVTMINRIPRDWLLVDTAEASTLDKATAIIPSDAEVICSYGVLGRFAERKHILALAAAPQTFQVSTRTVFFVITPYLGNEALDLADADADIEFVHSHLHSGMLIDEKGVAVLEWTPPPGTRTVVLPGRQSAGPRS
ncbi:MAG: hypothetical protein ACLP6E_02435 [Acidimicrobiales bacterium]